MTFYEFSAKFYLLSPIAAFIGLALGLFYYKRLDNLNKALVGYLGIMLFTDLASRVVGHVYGNNFIMLHIYSLLELIFFVYFYNRFLLIKHHKLFIILGTVGTLYIVGEILVLYIFNDINELEFQPYAKVADNFVIIVMALAFFLQRINAFAETGWQYFKLNTAVLCFFTLTAIVFLPFNFLVNDPTGLKFYLWFVNGIAIICFEVYITLLILKNGVASKK